MASVFLLEGSQGLLLFGDLSLKGFLEGCYGTSGSGSKVRSGCLGFFFN